MDATLDRWKGVPASALRRVIVRVPCEADRRSAARVCRSWSAALARRPDEAPLPLPPQLPWLMLLLPGGAAFSCVHRDDGSSCFHRVRIPGDRRYFFGSYDGRWLFIATGNSIDDGHMMLNLRDGTSYSIPREFRPEFSFSRPLQPGASRAIMMLVATLSAAPNEDCCIGAAIVRCYPFDNRSHRQITFWRMGNELAMAPHDFILGEPEDVLYFKGKFHFLVAGKSGEYLFVCRPVFNQHGALETVNKGLRPVRPHEYRTYDYEQPQTHVRYLVESRGELLMVVKSPPDDPWRFVVFQLVRSETTDPGHMLYSWFMITELDGRILFVGKGCSRSYEANDFSGFHSGVYFLDDLQKSNLDISVEKIRFPCEDTGFWFWWRMLPKVERCFRPCEDMSSSSPAVWLLP